MPSEDHTLAAEIADRLRQGYRQLSIAHFAREIAEAGYTLDRSLDCRSTARYLDDGRTYPATSVYPKETDTGRSAYNIEARRDDNYRRLQQLRGEIFAVSHGRIVEL